MVGGGPRSVNSLTGAEFYPILVEMQVQLNRLEVLQSEVMALDKQAFAERYPGVFLLAMGFLAAKEIPKRGHMPAGAGRYQPTAAVSFGMRRRHTAKQHPLAGQVFFLSPSEAEPSATIGRSESCQVSIPDESVSEFHCRLVVSSDGVFVIDLGSTNGTSVSLGQLEPNIPMEIGDEDVLSVGRYSFQLLLSRTLYDELSLLQAMEDFDEE